jgi:hypothetical protein
MELESEEWRTQREAGMCADLGGPVRTEMGDSANEFVLKILALKNPLHLLFRAGVNFF